MDLFAEVNCISFHKGINSNHLHLVRFERVYIVRPQIEKHVLSHLRHLIGLQRLSFYFFIGVTGFMFFNKSFLFCPLFLLLVVVIAFLCSANITIQLSLANWFAANGSFLQCDINLPVHVGEFMLPADWYKSQPPVALGSLAFQQHTGPVGFAAVY